MHLICSSQSNNRQNTKVTTRPAVRGETSSFGKNAPPVTKPGAPTGDSYRPRNSEYTEFDCGIRCTTNTLLGLSEAYAADVAHCALMSSLATRGPVYTLETTEFHTSVMRSCQTIPGNEETGKKCDPNLVISRRPYDTTGVHLGDSKNSVPSAS